MWQFSAVENHGDIRMLLGRDRSGDLSLPMARASTLQRPAKQAQGAGPGVVGGGGIIDIGTGVVEEGVVRVLIDAHFAVDLVLLEGFFEPVDLGGINPLVLS